MRQRDIFNEDGSPAGDYLSRFVKNADGRKCLLYIITKLGYFQGQQNEEQTHARNAAVALLNDIQEKTGFAIDMNFAH
jgi:acyl CoA:acetate/3-ketoacid CoA transferase beta subunit